jgi:Protein of unknown function (DUF2794)
MNAEAPIPFPLSGRSLDAVNFDRRELGLILRVYGRMVAAGEWRDYAIAGMRDIAVFAVFRRTAETPLYRIEKRPKMRSRQGLYTVVGMDGRVLRRGPDLDQVLKVLERRLIGPVT